MLIDRVAHGKIIEEWSNQDWLGLLQQLGVVPVPGQLVTTLILSI
jgi:hypothetical protein